MIRKLPVWVALLHLASAAFAAESKNIRIGFFPNITHAQALYARATGEFEKQTGATISWAAFNAGRGMSL